jgi:hypothetical protein
MAEVPTPPAPPGPRAVSKGVLSKVPKNKLAIAGLAALMVGIAFYVRQRQNREAALVDEQTVTAEYAPTVGGPDYGGGSPYAGGYFGASQGSYGYPVDTATQPAAVGVDAVDILGGLSQSLADALVAVKTPVIVQAESPTGGGPPATPTPTAHMPQVQPAPAPPAQPSPQPAPQAGPTPQLGPGIFYMASRNLRYVVDQRKGSGGYCNYRLYESKLNKGDWGATAGQVILIAGSCTAKPH